MPSTLAAPELIRVCAYCADSGIYAVRLSDSHWTVRALDIAEVELHGVGISHGLCKWCADKEHKRIEKIKSMRRNHGTGGAEVPPAVSLVANSPALD